MWPILWKSKMRQLSRKRGNSLKLNKLLWLIPKRTSPWRSVFGDGTTNLDQIWLARSSYSVDLFSNNTKGAWLYTQVSGHPSLQPMDIPWKNMKIGILIHRPSLKFQHRLSITRKQTKILLNTASTQKISMIKSIAWATMTQSNRHCSYGSIGLRSAGNGVTRDVLSARKLPKNTVSVQTVATPLNKLHCTFRWELKYQTHLDQFGLPLMMN